MDFTALKAELVARGYDALSATRQGLYINQARAELDGLALWPYREKVATSGVAPLTVTDLGPIQSVVDDTLDVALEPSDYTTLVEHYSDLTTVGSPVFFYVTTIAGTKKVATYPVGSTTITVQHWRVTADLSAGTDTPAAPADYHLTIVDLAEARATSDAARREALRIQIERDVERMMGELLIQHQGALMTQAIRHGAQDW